MSRALLAAMIAVLLAAHATAQEMVKDIGAGTYETWAFRLDLNGCGDRAMFLSTSPGGMTKPSRELIGLHLFTIGNCLGLVT